MSHFRCKKKKGLYFSFLDFLPTAKRLERSSRLVKSVKTTSLADRPNCTDRSDRHVQNESLFFFSYFFNFVYLFIWIVNFVDINILHIVSFSLFKKIQKLYFSFFWLSSNRYKVGTVFSVGKTSDDNKSCRPSQLLIEQHC